MSELKERYDDDGNLIVEVYAGDLNEMQHDIMVLEERLADSDKAHTERARKHIDQIRREHEQQLSTVKAELEEAHQEIASLQQCDCIERGAE